ncbi:MAG: hypothetical protein ABI555_04080 [Chloroflexota bacterium]
MILARQTPQSRSAVVRSAVATGGVMVTAGRADVRAAGWSDLAPA